MLSEKDNNIKPKYQINNKDIEYFTIKKTYHLLNEQNIKDVDTSKFIQDFPVNKAIPFDQNKMIKAIQYGMIITILYRGKKDKWQGGRFRTIMPLVMGINKNTGNLLIRAFHLDGYSIHERKNTKKVWRLFIGASIKSMTFTGDFFRLPPKGYKMNDRVMTETTIARADFNQIRNNQYKLVQADKIQKAEDTEVTNAESKLASQIEIQNTNTILDLTKPWDNSYMDKKKIKEIKLTFMKSVFGDNYIAIYGALGTPGRTVKLFDGNKLIGAYKTIQSFIASEITYKKQIGGKSEYNLYLFTKKIS